MELRSVCVSARFECREELESALWDLRRLGAMRCQGIVDAPAGRTPETVHLSVPSANASMVRAILRRAGGTILHGINPRP